MARPTHEWKLKPRRGFWYASLRGGPYFSTHIRVGNPKHTKSKAKDHIEKLHGATRTDRHYETFRDYASLYFQSGTCPWFARETGRGKTLLNNERASHLSRLDLHILPRWGDHRFDELSPVAIEKWLYAMSYSLQYKKHILRTLLILLRDMRRDRLIAFDPAEIQPVLVRHRKTLILSDAEASALFPKKTEDFCKVWGAAKSSGAFLALMYSTGMRTGELRALEKRAVHLEFSGLLVVANINRDEEVSIPKAKSIRALPVPKWTIELLRDLNVFKSQSGLLFPGKDGRAPLDSGSAAQALERALRRCGISSKVTPRGLRHGYNTRMRAILAAAGLDPYFDEHTGFKPTSSITDSILREFLGHRTPEMTELYDHPELMDQLRFFGSHFRQYVEQYWEFRAKFSKQATTPTQSARDRIPATTISKE